MKILCDQCKKPLPVHTFKGAHPTRQAVFVWHDGARVHVECAIAIKKKSRAKP